MNLIYQFYLPFKKNPQKGASYDTYVKSSVDNVRRYATRIGAHHRLYTKRWKLNDTRWVELDSVRVWQDPWFDQYDNVAIMDVDMFFNTDEDIFEVHGDALMSMVHERNFGKHRSCEWQREKLSLVVDQGLVLPKSILYPEDPFRFLNGGLQIWSRQARERARKEWMSTNSYYEKGGLKEQKYVNANIINNSWDVQELPSVWNCLHESWDDQPWSEIKVFHAGGTTPKLQIPSILQHIKERGL